MTFDNNVIEAKITKEVNHEKIPGVVLNIEQTYTRDGWGKDEVIAVDLPIGTKYLRTSTEPISIIENPSRVTITWGYQNSSVHFVPPKSSVAYVASAEGIRIARKNKITTKLQKFVALDIKDIPKILTKLRAAKAFVVHTRVGCAKHRTVLVYNGNYIDVGCRSAFDMLREAGIINKEGKILKTKMDQVFIAKNFDEIVFFVDSFSQLEAE